MHTLRRFAGTQLKQTETRLKPDQAIQLGHLFHRDALAFKVALHDGLGRNGLWTDHAADIAILEELGELVHGPERRGTAQAATEEADDHVLRVRPAAGIDERSHHVSSLKPSGADSSGICGTAVAKVPQVVGYDVVAGIVEDFEVRNKVHFDRVSRGAEDGFPGFQVRRVSRS